MQHAEDLTAALRRYPRRYFGAAFVSYVLEYVPDVETALGELRRVADELHLLTVESDSLAGRCYPGARRAFVDGRWRGLTSA